jgi:Fe-S-cluster containining protein
MTRPTDKHAAAASASFACRPGCGACCIAPSISSPLPGMPHGKPAGVRCVNLSDDHLCRLWGTPDYPPVCRAFAAEPDVCGTCTQEALVRLTLMEEATRTPGHGPEGI